MEGRTHFGDELNFPDAFVRDLYEHVTSPQGVSKWSFVIIHCS